MADRRIRRGASGFLSRRNPPKKTKIIGSIVPESDEEGLPQKDSEGHYPGEAALRAEAARAKKAEEDE